MAVGLRGVVSERQWESWRNSEQRSDVTRHDMTKSCIPYRPIQGSPALWARREFLSAGRSKGYQRVPWEGCQGTLGRKSLG